ncbi:MAG: hypothetical protein ACREHF_14605 [Rhizomicrobium sp.]
MVDKQGLARQLHEFCEKAVQQQPELPNQVGIHLSSVLDLYTRWLDKIDAKELEVLPAILAKLIVAVSPSERPGALGASGASGGPLLSRFQNDLPATAAHAGLRVSSALRMTVREK